MTQPRPNGPNCPRASAQLTRNDGTHGPRLFRLVLTVRFRFNRQARCRPVQAFIVLFYMVLGTVARFCPHSTVCLAAHHNLSIGRCEFGLTAEFNAC